MPRTGACAKCGCSIQLNKSSRPEGVATCRPCRWIQHHGPSGHRPSLGGYSRGCRCEGCKRANALYWLERSGIVETDRPCGICGTVFASRLPVARFCSDACRRERKREHSGTRRALIKGAEMGERVVPRDIHERDQWRCHICRRKLSPTQAWPHPRSATIDHLVPIAKGGAHEPANVRTACLSCNLSKCDRGGNEQLLLIG